MRMGCLTPLFRLLCGCCVEKKKALTGPGSPQYTRVPTDEFEFELDQEEGNKVPAII